MKRAFDSLSAGVQRKRQKIRSARTIASESASPALKAGAIPIQEFLASRRFEINALTESIQKSREAGVQRAFQSLPRYLRRRAASHNVKRVPRRLRGRAIAELKEEDQKNRGKRVPFKRKRSRKQTAQKLQALEKQAKEQTARDEESQPAVSETVLPVTKDVKKGRYLNRQRDKTWLPSHLWTCKRAKMETKFNYAIAISPNEKTYRSTHRASTSKGAIVFDTSYQGTILIKGVIASMCKLVESLTCSKHTCGVRARLGQRAVNAHIYRESHIICPSKIIWDPASQNDSSAAMIIVHPASHAEVWKLILNGRTKLSIDDVKVLDMRFEIGSVTVIGPLAINALLSVLKPSQSTESANAFKSFHGLKPEEIGSDVIYTFNVKDPRGFFPPKMITEPAKNDNQYLSKSISKPEPSPLFCHQQTRECNELKPASGGLQSATCPNIPVLVHRTNLGLVVMAPWAYTTDIWYSLNHLPLVRFGGLQELAQIYYTQSIPFFPNDYQGTTSGDSMAVEEREKRERWYLRRPPAKRLSFKKSINGKPEIGDPFSCDFKFLINTLPDTTITELSHVSASVLEKSSTSGNMTTTDVTMDDSTNISAPLYMSTPQIVLPSTQTQGTIPKQTISPVVKGSDITTTQESTTGLTPILILENQLSNLGPVEEECGIVQVKITLLQRGSPKPCARIYHCEGTQVKHLIGFLTTGNFSLAQGRATGIGSLRAKYVRDQSSMTGPGKKRQCFVRDVGSAHFRLASWEVISA